MDRQVYKVTNSLMNRFHVSGKDTDQVATISEVVVLPHVRKYPDSRSFFLRVKSRLLGFEFRNLAQGFWNPARDWNPEFKFQLQKSAIQIVKL